MSELLRASILVAAAAAALCATGCQDLDGFVWNPRHCSVVGDEALCKDRNICTPCDEPYDFSAVGVPQDAVTQVTVDVGGGVTNDAYFIEGTRPGLTLLYAHGNFGGIEHYLNRVGLLYPLGASLFVIDYRGFGKSSTDAEPTEVEFMADARAALAAAPSLADPDERLAVFGYSAGALAAVELAVTSERPFCAFVLEATWASVQSFSDDSTFIGVPQSFVTTGAWDNVSKMPDVDAPLLMLHGEQDDFVRLEFGREVFEAAASPDKRFVPVPRAGHGNGGDDVPTVMGADYGATVGAMLDERCR